MELQLSDSITDFWEEKNVKKLHVNFITSFLRCDSVQGKNAAVEFAKYLNYQGLDKYNYQIFLELFLHPDEDLINALLGDGKVMHNLRNLQKNQDLISLCFKLLKHLIPAKVNKLTLETILEVIYANYRNPFTGYEVYAVTIEDLYYVGKFLEKNKPKTNLINRTILDILADLGDLETQDIKEQEVNIISFHANQIRNVFFDNNISMDDVLPYTLLAGSKN